jgi:hypothetical protein
VQWVAGGGMFIESTSKPIMKKSSGEFYEAHEKTRNKMQKR